MNLYSDLANFYDGINQQLDYPEWANKILEVVKGEHLTIVDIGCGTGSMTLELAKKGHEVIGIDLSCEMLSLCQSKIYEEHLENLIQLSCQDMTTFEIPFPADLCVCALEGIGHLSSKAQLESCFQQVYSSLKEGAYFFFDVNTPLKFEKLFGEEVYTFEEQNSYIVWENHYNPKSKKCYFDIHRFELQKNGFYRRNDSYDEQRCWSFKQLVDALKKVGFQKINAYEEDYETVASDESYKWYFIVQK